jgi:uncharacterized repeat protein (TIGR03803 family)
LYWFTNVTDGSGSGPLLQGSDCNLYSATGSGGINTNGSIFSITTNGSFSTICSFPGANIPTPNPTGWLIQAGDGSFYGTANNGFAPSGTVFRATTNGTVTTLCAFFTSDELPGPYGPIALGTNGSIYGASVANNNIFSVSTNGSVFTTNFFLFDLVPYGAKPWGGLVQGTDGNFYGTTTLGGTDSVCYGGGTVFQITPSGSITNIHVFGGYTEVCSFADTNGDAPFAAPVQDYDGNFYGTTVCRGRHQLQSRRWLWHHISG